MLSQNSAEFPKAAASFTAIDVVKATLSFTRLLTVLQCTPIAFASSLILIPIGSKNSRRNISPTVTGLFLVTLITIIATPYIHVGLNTYLMPLLPPNER